MAAAVGRQIGKQLAAAAAGSKLRSTVREYSFQPEEDFAEAPVRNRGSG